MSDSSEIEAIGRSAFQALREMDRSCPTGLSNFVSQSPHAGKRRKDESAITWGITQALSHQWPSIREEQAYPSPLERKRCDRVIETDSGEIWLEVKLAWRTWFFQSLKHNDAFMYQGYFGGDHHDHSVSEDLRKLEQVRPDTAHWLALLLVGFDGADAQMDQDVKLLVERESIRQRGWEIMSESWQTQQYKECWIRIWYFWRETQD